MGRPIEFDRNEVLEQALQLFWNTGYSATSVANLVEATKLKPGSLYAAFKSKRGLFIATLDRYADRCISELQRCLAADQSPLNTIRYYFSQLILKIVEDEESKGCFLINTMLEVAPHDNEIHQRVMDYFNDMEGRFADKIKQSQTCGEVAEHQPADELAKFLMTGSWGLRIMGSTRQPEWQLQKMADHMLSVLTQSAAKPTIHNDSQGIMSI
ncbi:TetR/AcrR family transcriptional regulator [Zooshikella harenae]|uniref:TetR/AcrR family transcriptional regulator n=1 Tax=Zooshikella harenae TaxID=2827238 RepID=A0ABS5ZDP1_9GAMM|nr:TetR/AcrR family transcriptional regulator [Zooshikella harenae]MBU2711873.1 TetR/AcrR family transcriptional regulator [Zooshikella harenae]